MLFGGDKRGPSPLRGVSCLKGRCYQIVGVFITIVLAAGYYFNVINEEYCSLKGTNFGAYYGKTLSNLIPLERLDIDAPASWPLSNPVLSTHHLGINERSQNGIDGIGHPALWSDPQSSRLYLFFEGTSCKKRKRYILVAESKWLNGTEWRVLGVASFSHHASYRRPSLFAWNDTVYMVTDTNSRRDVMLHKATNFPLEWAAVDAFGTASPNTRLQGVSIMKAPNNGSQDEEWIMTARRSTISCWFWRGCQRGILGDYSYKTSTYQAPTPLGPWTFVPSMSPDLLAPLTGFSSDVRFSDQLGSWWSGGRATSLTLMVLPSVLPSGSWLAIVAGKARAVQYPGIIWVMMGLQILSGTLTIACATIAISIMSFSSCTVGGKGMRGRGTVAAALFGTRFPPPVKSKVFFCSQRIFLLVITLLASLIFLVSGHAKSILVPLFSPSPPTLVDGRYSKFSLIVMTYEKRKDFLPFYIRHYQRCASVGEIVIVWNGGGPAPAPDHGLEHSWTVPWVPVRVRDETSSGNSLNNRYKPDVVFRHRGALILDDDLLLPCGTLEDGFAAWRRSPQALVGFYPRLAMHSAGSQRYLYLGEPEAIRRGQFNLILTGAAFIDTTTTFSAYWDRAVEKARDIVDQVRNCDDILMNFVVANITRGLPSRVYPNISSSSSSPQLPPVVEHIAPKRRIDISSLSGVGLSHNVDHFINDAEYCLSEFTTIFGGWPLRTVAFNWTGKSRPRCYGYNLLDCYYWS